MNILFISGVRILVLIEWSYKFRPPIMLAIEPRMSIIFWARSPISFKHMSFRYPLLESHLTTLHSYVGAD